MTDTTHLRRALVAAAEFEDPGVIGRTAAVRARVAHMRRQRQVGALGVVAAIIAVAAAVTVVPVFGQHQPLDPAGEVAGVPVARTITLPATRSDDGAVRNAVGLSYRETNVQVARAGKATFETTVPAGSDDRAVVMVASGLGEGSATLLSGDGTGLDRIMGSQVGGAGAGSALEIGSSKQTFTIQAKGATPDVRLALVTYQFDPAATAVSGLSVGATAPDGALYRMNVGGRGFEAAGFAAPGQAEFTENLMSYGRPTQFVPYCVVPASAGKVWLNVSLGAEPIAGTGCGTESYPDAGATGTSITQPSTGNGHALMRVHVWISRHGFGGKPAVVDGAVFGLGVYTQGAVRRVAGMSLGEVIENGGRVWHLGRVVEHNTQRVLHITLPASNHARLLWFAQAGTAGTKVEITAADGTKEGAPQSVAGSNGSAWGGPVLLPGSSYDITMTSSRPADQALLVYDVDPDWLYSDPSPTP